MTCARSSEQELRRLLIEDQAVDVVVAVGPNMFYTVTLPVTLWFLDRGKKKSARADQILFLDARHSLPPDAAAGLVVLGWLAAQLAIIGFVSWMQPTTAIAGVLVLVLGSLLPHSK